MRKILNINAFIGQREVLGVNIRIIKDDEYLVHLIKVAKGKRALFFRNAKSSKSLDCLRDFSNSAIPLYLSIDGKGVLHKTFEREMLKSQIEAFLPGSNQVNFVIQETLLSHTSVAVSFIRKEIVFDIIKKINFYGLFVSKITLGPFGISNLKGMISGETRIDIPFYEIHFISNSLEGFKNTNIEFQDSTLDLDSGVIETDFLVPFSNGLFHFLENREMVIRNIILENQISELRYKKYFQLVKWGILIISFILLLINYFLFDSLRRRNDFLESQIIAYKETFSRIEGLKLKLKDYDQLGSDGLSYNNNLITYYLDRIALSINSNISLTKLCVSPPEKSQTDSNQLKFAENIIIVSGNSTSGEQFDSWIKAIRRYKWIKEVRIKNYTDSNLEVPRFEIELKIGV